MAPRKLSSAELSATIASLLCFNLAIRIFKYSILALESCRRNHHLGEISSIHENPKPIIPNFFYLRHLLRFAEQFFVGVFVIAGVFYDHVVCAGLDFGLDVQLSLFLWIFHSFSRSAWLALFHCLSVCLYSVYIVPLLLIFSLRVYVV